MYIQQMAYHSMPQHTLQSIAERKKCNSIFYYAFKRYASIFKIQSNSSSIQCIVGKSYKIWKTNTAVLYTYIHTSHSLHLISVIECSTLIIYSCGVYVPCTFCFIGKIEKYISTYTSNRYNENFEFKLEIASVYEKIN